MGNKQGKSDDMNAPNETLGTDIPIGTDGNFSGITAQPISNINDGMGPVGDDKTFCEQ